MDQGGGGLWGPGGPGSPGGPRGLGPYPFENHVSALDGSEYRERVPASS